MKINNKLTLKQLIKPYLFYMDSYSYYGLWDENFLIYTKDGKVRQLTSVLEKTIDVSNVFSTKDAMQLLVVNLNSVKKEFGDIDFAGLHYYNMQNKGKLITIEIIYFDKAFEEKYIPRYIKEFKQKEKDDEKVKQVKLTFIYDNKPFKELGFMNESEMAEILHKYLDMNTDIAKETINFIKGE